jgi:hypothetical protein
MNPSDDVVRVARAFAARTVAPLLQAAGSDGALERLPLVARDAVAAGLIADGRDAQAEALALWGADLGILASCGALVELGATCAGVGMALHAHALAARLRLDVSLPPATTTVVACPISPRCPPASVLDDPRAEGGSWVPQSYGAGELSSPFEAVWAFAPAPDAPFELLAFVRGARGWELVHAARPDASIETVGAARLGLRACRLLRVTPGRLEANVVAAGDLARRLLHDHIARLWLGMAALGAGTARAAVQAAAGYAVHRRQGGSAIARHAAVEELLGEAAARAASAEQSFAEDGSLVGAARRRLTCLADAALAVTQSLQVMGGNGYMEDYRMEKRLRDVEVLRTSQGSPVDLRRIVAASLVAAVTS